MNPINERIALCIKKLEVKKTYFAQRLNVSQAFVTQMTKGVSAPSDRTISDICREFNVNEDWLRTGEGDMFIKLSRKQEIADFIAEIEKGKEDSFQMRLVSALSRLNVEQWALLEEIAKAISENEKEADP